MTVEKEITIKDILEKNQEPVTEDGIGYTPQALAFLSNPEWTEVEEGGVIINQSRNLSGVQVETTFLVSLSEEMDRSVEISILGKVGFPRTLLTETQPSWGFHEPQLDVEHFKIVYDTIHRDSKRFLFFIDGTHHKILALVIMASYFRESFSAFSYLDFASPRFGCGKSTALQFTAYNSFYGVYMTNPSLAILFRLVNSTKGVVTIDEIDNLLGDAEIQTPLLGLLNNGYKKGALTMRMDMSSKPPRMIMYDAFSMKAFSHTGEIPPSFGSRSIVFNMTKATQSLDEIVGAGDFTESRDILYNLRLYEGEMVRAKARTVFDTCGLTNRDREKFSPILTMAKMVSDSLYDEILEWSKKYIRTYESEDIDEILFVLVEVLYNNEGFTGVQYVQDIAREFNQALIDSNMLGQTKDGSYKKYGSRTVSKKLKKLGMTPEPKGERGVRVFINRGLVIEHAKMYDLADDSRQFFDSTGKSEKSPLMDSIGFLESKTQKPQKQTDSSDNSDEKYGDMADDILTKPLSLMDKFLVKHSVGSGFSPTESDMDMLAKASDQELVFEQTPGIWGLTEKARKRIEQFKEGNE